jgi:hypothetical protein
MEKLTITAALGQVFAEMKERSPEQLAQALTSPQTGQFSACLKEAQEFLETGEGQTILARHSVPETEDEQVLRLRLEAFAAIRAAEKAAYAWFCACPVGTDRDKAHEVYQNVRCSTRVGGSRATKKENNG